MECDDEGVKPVLLAVLAAALVASACTGGSNWRAGPDRTMPPGATASNDAGRPADSTADSSPTGSTPGRSVSTAATGPALQVDPQATGIPGLDSGDRFCAAWSRFAGSWQALSVRSSLLGDPDRGATWEVASSAVVAEAYAALIDNFPEQLAVETHRTDAYLETACPDQGTLTGPEVGAT